MTDGRSNGDLLTVRDLTIGIRMQGATIPVVKRVGFRVPRGKTVALVGESGSGKSIIARSILSILPGVASISSGSILFRDPCSGGKPAEVDIARLDPDSAGMHAIRGGRISMVFQEPMTSFSPIHTIGNQVEESLILHSNLTRDAAYKRTLEMLSLVGFQEPERFYEMYPMELSGGLRQRAMIAMAIICNPALLIADEPTTALDVVVQAQVLALMKRLQRQLDMSMLLITHDLGVVANMADEVVVLYRGEVMETGSCREILEDPRHPYLKGLLGAIPKLGAAGTEKLVSLREIRHTVETNALTRKRVERARHHMPLLTVENLSKSFTTKKSGGLFTAAKKKIAAVDDVGFEVMCGECFGIVGGSGSGKSTLIRLITRALTADAGRVTFHAGDGPVDMLALEGRRLKTFRPKIQMVFQDPFASLSPRSTVQNILTEPLEIHGVGSPVSRREKARDLMRLVGLPPESINRYPHSFSGGQRQRIGIARALALEPEILVCDEAVSALDVSVQAQILNLLKKLQSELGLTMIFISHNMAVVNYIANRIAVMRQGRIVELAPREKLFAEPAHPYTRCLLSAIPDADLANPLNLSDFEDDVAAHNGMEPEIQAPASAIARVEVSDGHFYWPDPTERKLAVNS
ncbi:dipeptide ABC transporter ATP-binding protein [Oricola sp.]|uniref:dipeptide ABC transporter ATP-binding protein n=1 Tax=Oricola sp. TaxID=1979950 RepID=UPI003BAA79C7